MVFRQSAQRTPTALLTVTHDKSIAFMSAHELFMLLQEFEYPYNISPEGITIFCPNDIIELNIARS